MTTSGKPFGVRPDHVANRLNRRCLIRAAAAGAAGVGFAGFGGAAPAPVAAQDAASPCGEASGAISYGIWDIAQKPGVDAQIAAFNQKFPNIQVTTEIVPWDDYWTKLQTGVGGGKTYDVFWMNADHFPVYAAQGSLEPLTATIDAGGIDPTLYPDSLLDIYTFEETIYGIPRDFDTIALAYNKELFDAAGVEYPTDAWTWDDLRAAAEKLTIKDGDEVSQWGFVSAVEDQQNYANFIFQNEGEMLNADRTECLLDQPAACEALMYLTGFATDNLTPNPAVQQANPPYETLFPAGVIAMAPSGSWNMKPFNEANPAIDIAPLPMGKKRASVIHGLSNVIWAQGPNKCAALEWVKFLATKEAEEILGNSGTVIPAMTGLQDAWVASLPDMNLQVFLDSVAYSIPIPTTPKGSEWASNIQAVLTSAWNGELPRDQMCAKATEAANSAL